MKSNTAAKKKPKKKTVYKLTLKQENFSIYYVESGNATASLRRAYNCQNMKEKTINEKASILLKHCKVQARIKELRSPIFKKLEVSQTKTLKRLMQGQEFDIRKMYKKDGTLKKLHNIDDDTAKAIVGVKHDSEGNVIEYKIIDVKGCAELIGKNLKLWTDKVDLGGQEDNPVKEVIDVKGMDPKKLMEIIRGKTGV